jgi:HK97 family phage prohead protease
MTMTKTLDFNLEIKASDDDGRFEGLASPYGGKPDSYGDIVEKTAYDDTLKVHRDRGTMPVMLWAHDQAQPIGVWEKFESRDDGLYGTGRLIKGVRQADEAHLLMKHGAVRGLSIGYRVVESVPDGKNTRLKKIDLHEVSIVAIPAAPLARIVNVKADSDDYLLLRARLLAGDLPSDRELDKGLKAAFDLSNSQAERAVRLFRKGLAQGEPENEPNDDQLALAAALLRDAIKGFSDLTRT